MFKSEKFFGRQDMLGNLWKRLDGFLKGYRQNIAILGQESIGKTWLVRYFAACINQTKLITIYIDMTHPDIKNVINRFLGSLLLGYFRNNNLTTNISDNTD